jgi:serine phosphatase RsbU (regulator of sigma subunit)
MDDNQQFLRQKAMLLIAREREVLALRRKQKRLSRWLALAHKLPKLIDPKFDVSETCGRVSREMVSVLDLQRVIFFEMPTPMSIRPLTGATGDPLIPVTIGPAAELLLAGGSSGVCAAPSGEDLSALRAAVGLERFLWYRMAVADAGPMLFVAGYDGARAAFYAPFDADDLAHFTNTAHQLELLLGNINLVRALERDNRTLQQFNIELERRVDERTRALGASNGDLMRALDVVRRKDQYLDADIERARLFQATLLPVLPVHLRIEFSAVYRPLERVGGDVYDVHALGPERFRVFLADATGHGVQAAMRTIVIKAEYDRLKESCAGPDALLQELGRKLWTLFPNGEVMTTASCFDVTLTSEGAEVVYANAGNPPLIHWERGAAVEICCDGPFLGIDAPPFPAPRTFRMRAGESAFAFTDGLSEQTDGTEAFFEDHFRREAGGERMPVTDVASVMGAFDAFRGETAVTDDITMIGLRLTR